MRLHESTISALMNESEFSDFQHVIIDVCRSHPDIEGVVITGSLTQKLSLPQTLSTQYENPQQAAYGLIEKRQRRRIFPSATSDLDVWVCLKNPEGVADVSGIIESRAIELIDWLACNSDKYPTEEWAVQKAIAFDSFYKKTYMYTNTWMQDNPTMPWRGSKLKREITGALEANMPSLVERINYHFQKKIPGDFLELRAFPSMTFNLRPDETFIDGVENKNPFPRIIERLLDFDRNCFVLYVSEQGRDNMVYPLNAAGKKQGQGILEYINDPKSYKK